MLSKIKQYIIVGALSLSLLSAIIIIGKSGQETSDQASRVVAGVIIHDATGETTSAADYPPGPYLTGNQSANVTNGVIVHELTGDGSDAAAFPPGPTRTGGQASNTVAGIIVRDATGDQTSGRSIIAI